MEPKESLRDRTQIDYFKRPVDIWWGGGVKDRMFSKFLFYRNFLREFSPRKFILQLSFAACFVSAKAFRQK